MRIKRSQAYAIRGAIHETEKKIERSDRSQMAEYERDLVATACVALWEVDIKKLLSCLRRLSVASAKWLQVLDLVHSSMRFAPDAK